MKEKNCINGGPRDEGAAQVEFLSKEVSNPKNLHSQVTIKEENLKELGLWGLKDVIVGEVQYIMIHLMQGKILECSLGKKQEGSSRQIETGGERS